MVNRGDDKFGERRHEFQWHAAHTHARTHSLDPRRGFSTQYFIVVDPNTRGPVTIAQVKVKDTLLAAARKRLRHCRLCFPSVFVVRLKEFSKLHPLILAKKRPKRPAHCVDKAPVNLSLRGPNRVDIDVARLDNGSEKLEKISHEGCPAHVHGRFKRDINVVEACFEVCVCQLIELVQIGHRRSRIQRTNIVQGLGI